LIRQNKGAQSTARVQVAAITCDECGAIPWDEFQVNFENSNEKQTFRYHTIFYFTLS
jgi:ribosomal protein S26